LQVKRQTFHDFRHNPWLMRTKSIFYIFLAITGVIYSGIVFYYSVTAFQSMSKNSIKLTSLVTNWSQKTITDIMVMKEGKDDCPIGYEMISN